MINVNVNITNHFIQNNHYGKEDEKYIEDGGQTQSKKFTQHQEEENEHVKNTREKLRKALMSDEI